MFVQDVASVESVVGVGVSQSPSVSLCIKLYLKFTPLFEKFFCAALFCFSGVVFRFVTYVVYGKIHNV